MAPVLVWQSCRGPVLALRGPSVWPWRCACRWAQSHVAGLLWVESRSSDAFCRSGGSLCSVSAGMSTNSSGGCYSLILLKASKPLRQSSHWSRREFFTPSTCRITPVSVEHFRIPWEETGTLTREMPFPSLQYSTNPCMVTVYKILQGKYKWKTGFPSFCLD